ncbi:MAG: Nif3-like dinuclear metal center hexameric protein [Bacteroidales bacterium]|jgi:dinuclear metal center YbgI/SA1388 family protein
MKLKELCSFLDREIPLSFQESYDNSGLQTGIPEREITSALLTLDVTEEVLDEAVAKKCDVIISHHPVIFSGLKRVTGRSVTERIIFKAIKNDVAIYSAHTNLDALPNGVSRKMAEKLDLHKVKVLSPLKNSLLKLVVFVPESYADKVRESLLEAGAGVTGNYDECSFSLPGKGSFRPGAGTKPFAGEKGKLHFENEIRLETILFTHKKESVIEALMRAHPYEEPAYDIFLLENSNTEAGMGCIGELKSPMDEMDFLKYIDNVFTAPGLRYSKPVGKKISKVALCGGSGAFMTMDAISRGADAFLTADIKYHAFFEADGKILLADIGHYESEKYSVEILYDLIIKKFPTFALRFSEINTNPINYF